MDTEKIKMEINIAGEHIKLSVPFNRQDLVRDTEKGVAELYDSWRLRFPRKSESELLAMIAYQYASYYYELLSLQQQASARVEQLIRISEEALENGRRHTPPTNKDKEPETELSDPDSPFEPGSLL